MGLIPWCGHAELLFGLRTRANFTAYLTTPPGTSQIQRLYRLVLDHFVVMEIFCIVTSCLAIVLDIYSHIEIHHDCNHFAVQN